MESHSILPAKISSLLSLDTQNLQTLMFAGFFKLPELGSNQQPRS